MSNYATEDDVKLNQLVMTAAILKASLEKAVAEEGDLLQLSNDDDWKCDLSSLDYVMRSTTNFGRRERSGLL